MNQLALGTRSVVCCALLVAATSAVARVIYVAPKDTPELATAKAIAGAQVKRSLFRGPATAGELLTPARPPSTAS